jgi:hypothetical protein
MNDISEILRTLLDQYSRVSEMEREFVDMMNNDPQLREDYNMWCEEYGYDPKSGYIDFLDEQLRDRDEFWETLEE